MLRRYPQNWKRIRESAANESAVLPILSPALSATPILEFRLTLPQEVRNDEGWGVPAGVCTRCGTRYYAANVLKTIEESLRGRRRAEREVLVPVYLL